MRLTYQERMILTLLLRGRSNNAIADYLCLSNKTISYHKRSVMKRICRELSPHSPNSRSLFLSAPYLVGYPLAQPPAKGLTATHLGRH
ncbi:helix-turn-helix domain-containing protein [Yersinia massiliensis]|uniref:helix-turn-helix domain-containing protein n=1 Tax=Yersinia massiliensis TaxID=419257 RepID=UPI003B431CDA